MKRKKMVACMACMALIAGCSVSQPGSSQATETAKKPFVIEASTMEEDEMETSTIEEATTSEISVP